MINTQIGGEVVSQILGNNILNNIDTNDDINSIFMNLEEENIKLMTDFIKKNEEDIINFEDKNQESLSYLHDSKFLIIQNPDNFEIDSSQINPNSSKELITLKLNNKFRHLNNIGFSTINPDDDDDDNVDKLMLNKIRLFGNNNDPLFKTLDKEIKRRQTMIHHQKEEISKKSLAKLLEIERNNRKFEIQSQKALIFRNKQLKIKKYVIYTLSGLATIGFGIIAVPYIMGPTGLIQTLTHIFETYFSQYLKPELVNNLGGDVNGNIAFELAKTVTNMVKNHQIKIVFSVFTILSAGANSKGGIEEHFNLMLNATKEESKNLVKGFITFSMRPLVQNKVTGLLSELLKDSQLKSPMVFTFIGKLSGFVASDITTYLLEKVTFFEPAAKIKEKEEREKLKNKNISDIQELENIFEEKSTLTKLNTRIMEDYNYFTKNNPKMTAAISIIGCLGMSNLLVRIADYSWDGITDTTGDFFGAGEKYLFGTNNFNDKFLDGFIKKLFTTETIFNHFKRNYIIPFLRTQLREIVNLDYIWYNNYFSQKMKEFTGYKKSDEWQNWKELNSKNFSRKLGFWFFGYIFDLPKRFIEEELVNGLASCISNEKNFIKDNNCNNLHDIVNKLSTYEGEELMRHLIQNPLFNKIHTIFISDDDYNSLNIDIKLLKFMKNINKNMVESVNDVHQADFFKEIQKLVPEDLEDRDEFVSKILYIYINPAALKPIDDFSLKIRQSLNKYFKKDTSHFEGKDYSKKSEIFTSDKLLDIIEDTVPKDYIGRSDMVTKLFQSFSDLSKQDSAIVYGEQAMQNIRKRNQEAINFLLNMDSDLKKLDKLSKKSDIPPPNNNQGDDSSNNDNISTTNTIKNKYILSYRDIKLKIYKDIYGSDNIPSGKIEGKLLQNYKAYLDRYKLPPTLKDNIISNINSRDGKLTFEDSIIFHKVDNLDKNNKQFKDKILKKIKESLEIESNKPKDKDGIKEDTPNVDEAVADTPNNPESDSKLKLDAKTIEQLNQIKSKLIDIKNKEHLKNLDNLSNNELSSLNEEIDTKYTELSQLLKNINVDKVLNSELNVNTDTVISDNLSNNNLVKISILLDSIREKQSYTSAKILNINREHHEINQKIEQVQTTLSDLKSNIIDGVPDSKLLENIATLTEMHRKLATRDEYLYSQREKYTNLFEMYSSQYQQLLNSEFITTNTIDINDEDLSDNIAKYIHYINNISPLIGNIEQDSEIPTNIDSINIQPSLDTANLYNSQMNEKKSLAESIEKLTFPSQASINTHKKLIIEKSVNELKGYLNNLKERRLDIEILTGSYSKESYIKFQDFSNQELNERAVNLKNYRGNLEIDLKNFIKIQDFTKQKLGKIDKNIIIGENIEEYNKLEIFSKNTYAKSYINNFNEYLNDKNIAKPKFESNKLENGDNTFFPNGYNIPGETVIKDNLEKLNNHHQDRLEATQIITFIETRTDFYNTLKIKSPSLTADTFRQKLHSMKLEDLKNIKQLDNKFDTLDHEHKNWKTKSDNNIKFIRHHQKLVASYKLASSIKEDISKYTQYRREFSKNIASTSTNYDKLSGLDTNKIKATILSDIILENKNSKEGLKKLEDELNDIDNGVNDINTKTETAKSFQTEIDAFINAKMNGVGRKIAKKEGKAYQPATKEENVIKFKFANNLIITSMKTKLSALNDFMSKTDLKEKYSELLDISEKTVEQLSIEEVEKMDHLYNELLDEFKPNGESDCVGMCKYIDSWTKNANSAKDGKSSELSSSYIYTSWIKRNNFLSKRSLTIGATKYIGTKVAEAVTTEGLSIPVTLYEVGEKVFNSRNAIGELNNAFDRLVEASDVIETYLNYDDDSNIIEAIDYIHGIRDTVSIVDDYLGGKKTRDMDWSKLYKITEDKLSDSLDNRYSKRKGSYTNRDYFDLENFFLLSALEAGDAGKEKAIDKLGDIFKFFNSGDDKPPKSKILNEKVNTVKVWDAVTEASEIFEKAVGFGKAGEYLHLGHNLDKKIKVDEFYSVGTQMKGSFDTFHEELDSDYQGMIWHSNNNNDPTQTSKKGAIWSDFDFTRAQHDLRDIKERNKHRERSKKYIGIDPNSGEHINKDDMEKERYLKRQTAEVVANLDPVKKFIRKVQDDHVLSKYNAKEIRNYRKYIEHLDSKETIPNNEKLNQEELDVALNIVNDNSFPTQESIYSGDVHIESDKLFGRYNIGDTVDIKLRTWSKYFTGKITSRNSDGTFNVKTDDNSETELNINSEYIKTEHDSIFGGNPDVKSMSFKDAVFYGLQLESQRKINVLIKNPITYEDELMRTRVAYDSRNVHGFRLDSELSFLDDYNYRYLSSEGTISGLNNLGIDTRDMFELGKNNKITGIESITLDGEIRFLYSKSSKEDDAISNIASDEHFFGEFGKKRDTSLDGNINNIRQKFYEHSSDIFKGIENADSSLLWKRILMENSIKINRDNDPEKMDRLMSLLGITGDSKENDRAILESKGLSWCNRDYKSVCDITKEQKFTFVDDNDVSHNIIIKGDIFYQGHYIYQNEIEIDVTTDDWDSLIKLKEYLYGY